MERERTISVTGLGYVGLPVAVAFARRGPVIAFDIDEERVAAGEAEPPLVVLERGPAQGYDRAEDAVARPVELEKRGEVLVVDERQAGDGGDRIDSLRLEERARVPASLELVHLGGIALADEELRRDLAERYPETWERIQARRAFMDQEIGIRLKAEVLPFSNLPAYLPPFLLSPRRVMTVARA